MEKEPKVMPQRSDAPAGAGHQRLAQLDGWRGISIACVLASHLLPLGPKAWQLNEAAGLLGMNLFFTLSGFLIVSFLLKKPDVRSFAYRRLFRIVPLAWLYLIVVLTALHAPFDAWRANLLFSANYEDGSLGYITGHMWSLCVEIHFYVLVGVLVKVFGVRGLWVLPPLMLAITCTRIAFEAPVNIRTHLRMDDVLAGACLALVAHSARGLTWRALGRINPFIYAALLCACSLPAFDAGLYVRPYLAGLLVGSTLAQPEAFLSRHLINPVLAYLAKISYAVYVIHPAAAHGWLSEGPKLTMYLFKRPLTFLITFGLAHLSTKYYEEKWIALGRRLAGEGGQAKKLANA